MTFRSFKMIMVSSPRDRIALPWSPWALGLILCLGCGGSAEFRVVRGRVQFADGSPVNFGVVESFSEERRRSCRGFIAPDGSFAIGADDVQAGATAGRHQVIVVQRLPAGGEAPEHRRHMKMFHPRYARFEASGLVLDVVAQNATEGVVLTVEPAR